MPRRPGAGRPKMGEGDRGTRLVRVFDDLADMLSWIVRIKGGTTAQLLDPLVRPQIAARFATIAADVERIRALEEQTREAERAAQEAADESEPRPKRKRRS